MGVWKWIKKESDRKNDQTSCAHKPSFEQLESRLLLSASIEGTVWNDINGNGAQDVGESGLINWTVTLDSGQSTNTDNNGNYQFADLNSGVYTVSPDMPTGWLQTSPIDNSVLQYESSDVFRASINSQVEVQKVEVDTGGNTYIAGRFSGTADLDPSVGTDLFTSQGSQDIFLVKFNVDGSRAWTATWKANAGDVLGGVAIDQNGDVLVTGSFSGSNIDMDPTAGTDAHSATGYRDAFLTKINADGSYGFTYTFGGSNASTAGADVAVDANGNIYLTGSFNQTVDFDPTADNATQNFDFRTSPGQSGLDPSLYVTRINADGSYGWTQVMGASTDGGVLNPIGRAWGRAIAVDSQGTVYVGGDFNTKVDFDPDPNNSAVVSYRGEKDIFVVRLNTQGDFQSVWQVGGSESESLVDLTLDAHDNVYWTGSFSGAVQFDPVSDTDYLQRPGNIDGWFATRMDADGSYGWTRVSNSLDISSGTGLAADATGQVVVAVHAPNAPSAAATDVQLISLDVSGQIRMTLYWDVSTGENFPELWDVALDHSGATLLGGRFSMFADLDPTDGLDGHSVALNAASGFVARLSGSPSDQVVSLSPNGAASGVNFGIRPEDPSVQLPVVSQFSASDLDDTTPGYTDKRDVRITLTAADMGGVITEWMVTESDTAPVANDSGWQNWATTPPSAYSLSSNSEGAYTLYAWVKDNDGYISSLSAGSQATIVLDTTPPNVSMQTVFTSDPSPALNGWVDDSQAIVDITLNGATYRAVNNGDGTWTLARGQISPLANGFYTPIVTATDRFGRTDTDTNGSLTIEVVELSLRLDENATDSGTYFPGNSLSITVDIEESGGTSTLPFHIQARLSPDQNWDNQDVILLPDYSHNGLGANQTQTITFSANIPAGASAGTYYLLAKIDSDNLIAEADEVNNIDVTTTANIVLMEPDLTSPTLIDWGLEVDSGASNQDKITNDSQPALNLVFSEAIYGDHADIQILSPGGVEVVPNGITGWGTSHLIVNFPILSQDGVYVITLRSSLQDFAGNAFNDGINQVLNITLDTVQPTVTVDVLSTDDSTPPLSGTISEPVEKVDVTVDGITYAADVNQNDLTWSLADNTIETGLRHGFHDIRVTATDLAGNINSDDTVNELMILWEGYLETFPVNDLTDLDQYQEWTFHSTNEGRFFVSNGQLRMDDAQNNEIYSLNEATLILDLTDLYNLRLSFSHLNTNDNLDALPDTYTGSISGDGVSISVNGFHWVKLTDLDESFASRTFQLEDALVIAGNMAGSTDRSQVRVKFQQYGHLGGSTPQSAGDGRNIDDVRIDYLMESEIVVTGEGQEIVVGDSTPSLVDGTNFGRVRPGTTPVTRSFTVTNTGYQPLQISEVTVPDGFVVVQGLPATIMVQQSATLIVAMDTTLAGEKTGEIVIYNNDATEYEFNFSVMGTVSDLEVTLDELVTNDTTPPLTGTVNDPGAEVIVTVAGQDYVAVNNQNGTWSLADDIINELAQNYTYTVKVSAQDSQTGEVSDTVSGLLVLDNVAPAVTVDVDSTWGEIVTTDTTPDMTGTVSDPTARIVVVVNELEFDAMNNMDGTWTLMGSALNPGLMHGAYDVTVKAIDDAGNEGLTETTLFVDLLPPSVKFWLVEGDEDGVSIDWVTWVSNPHVTFEFTEPVLLKAGTDPLTVFEVTDMSANFIPVIEVVGVDLETGEEHPWGEADQAYYGVRFKFGEDLVPPNSTINYFEVKVNAEQIVDRAGDELADSFVVLRQFGIETIPPVVTLKTLIVGDVSPALSGTIDDSNAAVVVIVGATVDQVNDPNYVVNEDMVFSVDRENIVDGIWTLPAGIIPELELGAHDVVVIGQDQVGNRDVEGYQVYVAQMAEEFNSEDALDNWLIVNQGTIGFSNWFVQDGVLRQTGTNYSQDSSPGQWVSNGYYPVWQPAWSRINNDGTFAYYREGDTWTDVKISATVKSTNPNDIGIMFRYNPDTNTYYRFSMSEAGQFQRLMKVEGTTYTLLAERQVGYALGVDHQVEIVADGTLVQVKLDGEIILEVSDYGNATPALTQGTIALYTRANNGGSFDNIAVANMDLADDESDNQAPRAEDQEHVIRLDKPIQLFANAHDPDNGPDALSYSWTVDPLYGRFSNNAQTSTEADPIFIPNSSLSGDQEFTIKLSISDGVATTDVTHTLLAQDLSTSVLLSDPFSQTDDSFADGQSNGWIVVDQGEREGPSQWEIRDSETVYQMSNIFSWPHSLAMKGTYIYYGEGTLWTDYQINLDMTSRDDDGVGIMFRYHDENNYYRFEWNNQTGVRRIVKAEQGVFTVLAQDNVLYTVGQTYDIEIQALWTDLKVRVNGDEILTASDATFADGSVGLYSWGNVNGNFRGLTVTNLEDVNQLPYVTASSASPAVINDYNESSVLTVTANDRESANLSFTWELHADNPNAGILSNATQNGNTASVDFTPSDVTGHEWVKVNVHISDGDSGVTIHTYSILVTDYQAAILADEPFDNNFANWATVDQGNLNRPSNWEIRTSGSRTYLEQNSDIYSNDAAQLGTFAAYNNGSSWKDVGIDMEMNSTDDDGIGVMFRVVDQDNYYRLNWNNQTGARRLEKIVDGVVTVLAEESALFNLNHWYQVSIQAIGNNLTVFLDGELVFNVSDSTHGTGTVALYSWNNDRAKFDNVKVTDLN